MAKKKTKMQKLASHEMRKYKSGKLHSGSKKGPVVRTQAQATAIMLSVAREKGLLKNYPPKKGK